MWEDTNEKHAVDCLPVLCTSDMSVPDDLTDLSQVRKSLSS